MAIAISLLPVLLFLLFLFYLDSFKLVDLRFLTGALLWGVFSALISYLLSASLPSLISQTDLFSFYTAPAIEESIKAIFILYLIHKKRIGFLTDAAIYGFSVGCGFALTENMLYLMFLRDTTLITWIIRGLGTAMMHGGATSLLALIIIGGKARNLTSIKVPILAFVSSFFLHSLFNHFYLNPLIQTIGIIILMPAVFLFIFERNEKSLRKWLDIEFGNEVMMLNMIRRGQFSDTPAGKYLTSVKEHFKAEVVFDMYCYIALYLELSVKAKRNIMLQESGLSPVYEDDMEAKLAELKSLRRLIGKSGEITLWPLIRMNYRDIWKLNRLRK